MTTIDNDTGLSSNDCELLVRQSVAEKLLKAAPYPLQVEVIGSNSSPEYDWANAVDDGQTAGDGEWEHVHSDVINPSQLADQSEEIPAENAKKRITVHALSITIQQPPTIELGQPVLVKDLSLKVSAQVSIGFNFLGNERQIRTHVKSAHLSGKTAKLKWVLNENTLGVVPEVDQLELLLQFKLFKWPLSYRVNITNTVNRRLQQQGPFPIVNLSSLGMPELYGITPVIKGLEFHPHEEGMLVCSRFEFSSTSAEARETEATCDPEQSDVN